jgi:hypothetical protein
VATRAPAAWETRRPLLPELALGLWGQRRIEPARAAVILLFEPVVAGFVGYAVGERLGLKGYAGAVVILASILVAEAPAWVLTVRSSTGETGGRVPMTGEQRA